MGNIWYELLLNIEKKMKNVININFYRIYKLNKWHSLKQGTVKNHETTEVYNYD